MANQSPHGVARTRIMVKKALKELQKTAGGTASAEAGSKMVIVNLNSLEHRMVECCCASFFSLNLPAASDKRQFHTEFFLCQSRSVTGSLLASSFSGPCQTIGCTTVWAEDDCECGNLSCRTSGT